MSKEKLLSGDKIKGGQAGGVEKRGNSLAVRDFKNDAGNSFTFTSADSPKEATLRGGAAPYLGVSPATLDKNPPVQGGAFSPEKAREGFPSNRGIKTDK